MKITYFKFKRLKFKTYKGMKIKRRGIGVSISREILVILFQIIMWMNFLVETTRLET